LHKDKKLLPLLVVLFCEGCEESFRVEEEEEEAAVKVLKVLLLLL
jgi:hypothetical protein